MTQPAHIHDPSHGVLFSSDPVRTDPPPAYMNLIRAGLGSASAAWRLAGWFQVIGWLSTEHWPSLGYGLDWLGCIRM